MIPNFTGCSPPPRRALSETKDLEEGKKGMGLIYPNLAEIKKLWKSRLVGMNLQQMRAHQPSYASIYYDISHLNSLILG
jgi:hypothetical protein